MPDSARRSPVCSKRTVWALSVLACNRAFAAHIVGTPGNDRIRGKARQRPDDRSTRPRRATTACSRARRQRRHVDLGPAARDRAFGADARRRRHHRLEGRPVRTASEGNRGNDTLRGDVDDVGDLVSPDRLFGGRGDDKLRGGDGSRPHSTAARVRATTRGRHRRQRLHVRRPRARHAGRRRRRRRDLRQPRQDTTEGGDGQRPAVRARAEGRQRPGRRRGRHRPRRRRRRPDRRPRRRGGRRQLRRRRRHRRSSTSRT